MGQNIFSFTIQLMEFMEIINLRKVSLKYEMSFIIRKS